MARDLIVFAEDWGQHPSSTQHLIGHLATSRNIVWVNSIGLRRPGFCITDIKRIWQKLTVKKQPSSNLIKPSPQFHIINPKTIPVPQNRFERQLAATMLSKQILPLVKKARLTSPILWTSLPTAVDMAGKLGESALVYYCGDDFSALAGVDHTTVRKREQELADKADLVITASDKLSQSFTSQKTRLLSHGVDYQLFSKPAARAPDLPNDGRPIAGFYGSLSNWLDQKLLKSVIVKLPNWHFVFIGKPDVDVSKLQRLNNVHFLGPRPHHLLPSYAQHWTVSLLPFVNNQQIRACNPLKLKEYLAAGQPIVSTPFPALEPYRHFVKQANHKNSFIDALQQCRHHHSNDLQKRSVAPYTWKNKAAQLADWLEAL